MMEHKEGDRVLLDKDFVNASQVTITKIHGEHFSDVKDDEGNEWTTMNCRLSKLPTNVKRTSFIHTLKSLWIRIKSMQW